MSESYEVTVSIGPCSEEDSEEFAVSILDLPLARKVHAAVAITLLPVAAVTKDAER